MLALALMACGSKQTNAVAAGTTEDVGTADTSDVMEQRLPDEAIAQTLGLIAEGDYSYFGSEEKPQDMPAYSYYSVLDLMGSDSPVLWLADGTGPDANSAIFASNNEGLHCIADIRGALSDTDTDSFTLTELPPLPGSDTPDAPTLLFSSRDEAGGYNMALVSGGEPVAFIFDRPDFMGGGRLVEAHNCFGDDDAIMQFYENNEGKDTALPKPQWRPLVSVEESE